MALPKITQEINTIKSTYLPKSGGVMTGNLAVSNMYCNKMSSSTTWGVGTTWNDAPSISLYGTNETSSGIPNCFSIRAGANKYALTGTPDGNLYWGGNNVITSAGGTINGSLHLSDVGTLYIGKGDWAYPALVSNTNSGFYAISGNSPNQAGEFICRANKDNSNFIDLTGRPDGALYWGGKPVMSILYEAGGIITYSNGLTFQWGSSYGSTTVNFPQPFAGYPVVYTTNNSVSDTSCNATTYVTGITPTYFTTYKIRGNSGNQVQDGGQFSWFALGYR